MISDDALLVRGGLMENTPMRTSLEDALIDSGRAGMSVFAAEWPKYPPSAVVRHARVCITTPALVAEGGFELEHTRDRNDDRHYTIWSPKGLNVALPLADELLDGLRALFRGPMLAEEVQDDWDTEALRRLQSPRPGAS